MNNILLATKECILCGERGMVSVPEGALLKYERGALIQDAMPMLPPDQREQIVSGIHPECWANAGFDDEGDE